MLSRVVAVAGDHRLGNDAVGHVAQTHRLAGGAGAAPRCARAAPRSASSSAGASRPVRPRSPARMITSGIAASMQVTSTPSIMSMRLPVGKQRTGDRAPGIEEVQADRRRRAGHAVDAGLAVVGDAPAGGQHRHVDARARVDVEHAHRGLAVPRRHQPLLDREGADAREHVAAVGPRVDRLLADADLGEQVVDVAARLRGLRDDRDLAGQRAAAADAVDLQQVGRADRADQRLVARRARLRAASRAGRTGRARCRHASGRRGWLGSWTQ